MLTGLTFFHMTKITHLTTLHDSISYTPRVLFNFPLQEKPTDTPTHKKKGKNKSAYTYYNGQLSSCMTYIPLTSH